MSVVLHHSRAKGTVKLVLIGIANHAGDGGAWPTVDTLAHYANVEPRAVQKALTKLVSLGEVRVHVQAGGTHDMDDSRRPNRYDILVECPTSCDRTMNHRDDRRRKRGNQGALWINPPSKWTPGVQGDTPPLSAQTPHPLSARTPKPELQPSTNHGVSVVSQPQTAREAEPDCSECSLSADECRKRRDINGHPYTPRRA